MTYVLSNVYSGIIAELKSNAQHFADNATQAPKNFAWYNGSYASLDRIAIHFEFGDLELESSKGFKKEGILPVTLHVVDDLYVEGREGDPGHDDFKKKLDYPFVINALLDNWGGDCFGKMHLQNVEPDHDNDNLIVHKLRYHSKVVLR